MTTTPSSLQRLARGADFFYTRFMRVLAIDPGYDRCGVAVVERARGDSLLYSDCITTKATMPFIERLAVVGKEIERLIEMYSANELAIENLYFQNNQKTAMRVAEVRGALMYIAAAAGLSVHEYTPPQVKTAVAGWGRADKKQLMSIVPKLLKIEKKIVSDDEFDAIALAITHLAHSRK